MQPQAVHTPTPRTVRILTEGSRICVAHTFPVGGVSPPADASITMLCACPNTATAEGFVLDTQDSKGCFSLQRLFVPPQHQGVGWGRLLLVTIVCELRTRGCTQIFLDDMSARARRPRNIYVQQGFGYDEPDKKSPEMTLLLTGPFLHSHELRCQRKQEPQQKRRPQPTPLCRSLKMRHQ